MSNSKWAKGLQSRLLEFPEGLLVAALYAAACWSAWHVSLDQFFLPAGIRVAALLVFRREMWPYLLLGDYVYLGSLRVPMIETYGLTWALLGSCYQFPLVAFLVHLHRRHILNGDYGWILPMSVLASITIGFGNVAAMHALWPEPESEDFATLAVRYSIGQFLAITTVTPLAILWMRPAKMRSIAPWVRAPSLLMTAMLLALVGAALFAPSQHVGSIPIQLLMAIPIVGLTFLHGWRGAAVGIPALNLAVHLSTQTTGLAGSFDPSTYANQISLAVLAATLILLGSALRREADAQQTPSHSTVGDHRMVRFSQQSLELTLRKHVLGIRNVYEDIDRAVCDLADWLEERRYFEMAKTTRQFATITSREIRDRSSLIYPTSLEHVGLYLALQVGGIAQEWRSSGRVAAHQLTGDPCQLSLPLQLTAYRSIAEVVSLILERERGPVRIRARCGSSGGSRGIVIVIGLLDPRVVLDPALRQAAFERLAASAASYGGKVDFKQNRLRMYLSDPA